MVGEAEEDDREEEHRGSGCEILDAIDDHVADPESGSGEEAEGHGDEEKRHDGRRALAHDEVHEYGDHCEAENYQHYSLDSIVLCS